MKSPDLEGDATSRGEPSDFRGGIKKGSWEFVSCCRALGAC